NLGLFKLSADNSVEQISWETLGRKTLATSIAPDRAQGGMWLGFYNGGLAHFRDGKILESFSTANGLASGRINSLRFDADGALWAAADGGVSRLEHGRITTLTSKNGLPCEAVHWTIEDDAQSVWMMMPCGLVRIAQSDLKASLAGERPNRAI